MFLCSSAFTSADAHALRIRPIEQTGLYRGIEVDRTRIAASARWNIPRASSEKSISSGMSSSKSAGVVTMRLRYFLRSSGVMKPIGRRAGVGGWRHQLTDCAEDLHDVLVLSVDTPLDLVEFAGQRLVRGEFLAHANEGVHDRDVAGDGAIGAQDRGEHRDTLLGERTRGSASAAPT